jgi:hypothetical protein
MKIAAALSKKLFIAIFSFALNPSVHVKLVEESPCAPNFVSSYFLPCKDFQGLGIPFWSKVPYMIVEYYLTSLFFTILFFNWSVLYLGLSWLIFELRHIK